MSVKIAVAQFASTTDVEANTSQIISYIQQAAEGGAALVVLPENAMSSDPTKSAPQAYSEPIDGPFVAAVLAAAKSNSISVLVGMTETNDSDPRPSNTLILASNDGELAGTYRKLHLYDAFGNKESDRVLPGEHAAPLIFDIDDLTFGAMTCYDLRFPEMARSLVDLNADVLIAPTAWVVGPLKEMHWETLLRARAIENTVYTVGAGQTSPHYIGQSFVFDPQGIVVSAAGEMPGLVFANVDKSRVSSVRLVNPSLSNRRFTVQPA